MKKKKLYLIMIATILVVFSFTGSVAYYRYVYTGNVNLNTSNVVFNVSSTNLDVNTQKINLGSNLKPGSSGSINVTFDSTGSDTDMYVTFDIIRTYLPDSLNFYYNETHNGIINRYYSLLDSSKESETLTLYWYWDPNKDDDNDNEYINKTISAEFNVSAVQISEYAVMKNGYLGKTEFWSDTYRPYIRTIDFGNDLSNLPSECTEENLCWNISESETQNKKVYGYLVDSGLKDSSDNTKTLYNLYIVSSVPIFAPSYCTNMFRDFTNLIKIDFNDNLNTSNVTNMRNMFSSCSLLTELDLSSFNTSNVYNTLNMFEECYSLKSLNLSNFNTSNVTNMADMFLSCSSLTELDLSNFNTSNVTTMASMFDSCSSLKKLDLSSFNTSNVESMRYMFYNCSLITTEIDIMCMNTKISSNYDNIFNGAATDENALIIVDYTDDTFNLAYNMVATKSSNSNVIMASKPISLYTLISSSPNNGVDTNIDFSSASSSTNGDGINIVSGTESDEYPIYYYRGNVTNNNIIYAGYCWLIVRTTETGGVKLIYNGVPSSGKCTSTGEDATIGTSMFNSSNKYSSYVGYMYGETLYKWDGDTETLYKAHLEDTSIIDSSNTETETIGTKTFSIAGRHVQNAKSSTIKIFIDEWYQNNILETKYESMLEDTVWCNDRSVSSGEFDDYDGDTFYYEARYRIDVIHQNYSKPTLYCERDVDKFTVSSSNGNGDLEYSIGMLTADELMLAGYVVNTNYQNELYLLTSNISVHSLTPIAFYYTRTITASVWNGKFTSFGNEVTYLSYVRPAISLKLGTKISLEGNGTSDNPYKVIVN